MIIILTILFLLIDIVSKLIVSNLMNVYDSIKIIDDFFYITYVRNTGAAWSIFANNTWFIIVISLIIIGVLVFYIYKNRPKILLEKVGYSLILGDVLSEIGSFIYSSILYYFDITGPVRRPALHLL